MKLIFPAMLAVLSSFAIAWAPDAEARVVGSGRVVSETRALSGFEAIALKSSIDVVVRQGAREAVEVQADDNLLAYVETVVEDGTLVIRFRKGESVSHGKAVKVTVDVVRLGSLAASGSGDVLVDNLKTPALKLAISGSSDAQLRGLAAGSFELQVSGSGDVRGSGSARQLKISVAGSGDVNLAGLEADDVTLNIAGSGDADVTANQSLAVSVAGSGDVRYGGSVTQVRSSVAGSGSVRRR